MLATADIHTFSATAFRRLPSVAGQLLAGSVRFKNVHPTRALSPADLSRSVASVSMQCTVSRRIRFVSVQPDDYLCSLWDLIKRLFYFMSDAPLYQLKRVTHIPHKVRSQFEAYSFNCIFTESTDPSVQCDLSISTMFQCNKLVLKLHQKEDYQDVKKAHN